VSDTSKAHEEAMDRIYGDMQDKIYSSLEDAENDVNGRSPTEDKPPAKKGG
jgi:hypothetical protein